MVIIKRDGILQYTDPEQRETYDIEDKEVLSFLREPIYNLELGFTTKDFIKIYKNYPTLLNICPDFQQVIFLDSAYDGFTKKDISKIIMSISIDVREDTSKAFFSVAGLAKFTPNAYFNFPVQILSLRNIINAEIFIANKLNLNVDVPEQSFSGGFPFLISNFTFFDFLMVFSDNLVQSTIVDDIDIDAARKQLHEIQKELAKQGVIPAPPEPEVSEEEIKENASKVMNQINDLLNPPKKDN